MMPICTHPFHGELTAPCPGCGAMPATRILEPAILPVWETDFYRRKPHVSLAAQDVGFDLRAQGMPITLPEGDWLSVVVDGPLPDVRTRRVIEERALDGGRVEILGERAAVRALLRRMGYTSAESGAAALLGQRGGQARSERKAAAVRENGRKGGRPPKREG